MDQWVEAGDFIAADVIRWKEAVFDRGGRRKKALRIGERQVIAEVIERGADGWVRLLVRHCTITRDDQAGKCVPQLKPETEVRRGEKTILRGKPERLFWNDEGARDAVIAKPRGSRFTRLHTD
jgi:hypothetical protein